MIALLALLLGIAAGLAAGGRVRSLMDLRLRYEVALLLLFVAQGVVRGRIEGAEATSWGMPVWIVASVTLCMLLAANIEHAGTVIAATGVTLNLLVVLANGGMPVASGQGNAGAAIAGSEGFYHLANDGTLVSWIGDAMPFALGRALFLVSPGDVLLLVGVASLVAGGMLANAGEPVDESC